MNGKPAPEIEEKLAGSSNIWLATVRPGGRPHLVPVWFVYLNGEFFICIEPGSVKASNINSNPAIVLALEDGSNPVICEGIARESVLPWHREVTALFQNKYDWDILSDAQYTMLIRITPKKWLSW
jgi:hypothetical protein